MIEKIFSAKTFIYAGILLVFGLIALAVYDSATSEKIVLTKRNWVCTQTKVETSMVPMSDGKGGTYLTSITESVCVEYHRI